jgi:flagellar biogenesis protein FliO
MSTMYGMRFSVFYDFFLILAIPLSCRGESATVKKALVLMLLLIIWFIWIIRMGWSGSAIYLFYFE